MKTLGIAVGALVCAAATSASAQSTPPLSTINTPPASSEGRDVLTAPMRAPANALELGVEAGYTQGFGPIASDPRVGAGPGGAVGVGLGYRIAPRWSLGVGGQIEGYGSGGAQGNGATLRGVTAGVRSAYHMSPYNRLDPYLSMGAGYRMLSESPAGNAPATVWHGLELGKVELGLDLRPSESVAISPVLGVDVNLFPWRAIGGPDTSPPNSPLSTFVFAGVQGRFDVGGTRENKPAP